MKKLFFDKKGDEKYLSIWWFFVIVFVGTGIIVAAILFHSADVDVGKIESEILYEKIISCLVDQGVLVEGFIVDEISFDIFKECGINRQTFEEKGYSLKLEFLGTEENFEIVKGDSILCGASVEESRNSLKCFGKTEEVLYDKNNEIKSGSLKLLIASRQEGERFLA